MSIIVAMLSDILVICAVAKTWTLVHVTSSVSQSDTG